MTDLDYLRLAYQAAAKSPDPSTQNGALLVDDAGGIIAYECNRFPNGVHDHEDRWIRPRKYAFIEHAERNVIYDAARRGFQTATLIMYCCWFACADCARAIIQAGISEVVGHDYELHHTAPHWKETIQIADMMLTEAGVKFRRVPDKIGGVKIRFNGELVEP